MSGVDPNLWSSLARQYLGGMNAPAPGQAGYKPRVVSTSDNVEYVPARFVLGAATLVQDSASPTTVLDQNTYAPFAGTYAALGTPDTCIEVNASGVGFTWRGANAARLLVQASLRVIYNSGNATYAVQWYVDGIASGAISEGYVSSGVAQTTVALAAILDVQPGSVVDLRITNTTNGTDAVTKRVACTALALESAA